VPNAVQQRAVVIQTLESRDDEPPLGAPQNDKDTEKPLLIEVTKRKSASAIFAASVRWVTCQGSEDESRSFKLVIATGLTETAAMALYFVAMKHLYVSFLLALKRGGNVVLSVAGGAVVFGETIPQRDQLCIGLMAVGVCLVVFL